MFTSVTLSKYPSLDFSSFINKLRILDKLASNTRIIITESIECPLKKWIPNFLTGALVWQTYCPLFQGSTDCGYQKSCFISFLIGRRSMTFSSHKTLHFGFYMLCVNAVQVWDIHVQFCQFSVTYQIDFKSTLKAYKVLCAQRFRSNSSLFSHVPYSQISAFPYYLP